jgi:hypothetical protein
MAVKFTPMSGDDSGVTQGAGMMKRMVSKNGPVAGKKEFFATLQKRGQIKRSGGSKGYGKKVL